MAWSDKAREAAKAARKAKARKGGSKTSFASSITPTPKKTRSTATVSVGVMRKLVSAHKSVRVGTGFGKVAAVSDVFGVGRLKTVANSNLPFRRKKK